MKILSAILLSVIVWGVSSADTVSITGLQGLDETRYHRIESAALQRGYDILVGLPRGYDETRQKSYPTIYILDGGEFFPLLRTYYNYLRNSYRCPGR